MLLGHYFTKHYRGHFYAKAQNLNRKLRAAYDAALSNYDLLLMPTLPMKATPLPPPDAPRDLYIQRAFEMVPNTAPFNASGHPAMSIPCGMSDGLPIGLMLTGKYWDESTIYRAAAALALVPMVSVQQYAAPVSTGSDAHVAAGVGQFLKHSYPTSSIQHNAALRLLRCRAIPVRDVVGWWRSVD